MQGKQSMAAHNKIAILSLPLGVFLIGALLSSWASYWLYREVHLENTAAFSRLTEQLSYEIEQRFRLPIYGLNGARGVYAASNEVTRQDFRAYVDSRNMKVEFPGVRGFGFIERVPYHELNQFLQRTRADGAPDFQIRQLSERKDAELLVIKFIEPLIKNRPALGLDVASELQRREAAEQAISSGKPTITGPIVLLQDNLKTAGVLLYVPLYQKPDMAGLHTRSREQLMGLLYAPIVVRELLHDVQPGSERMVHYKILDKGNQQFSEFYDNLIDHAIKLPKDPKFNREQMLELPGRTMRIQFSSMPAFEKSVDMSTPLALGVIGWILSLALSLVFWQQIERRSRAEQIAESMTSEIQRLALVVKRTSNAVIITDVSRNIVWVNPAFETLTGYTEAEVLGKNPAILQNEKTDRHELKRLSQHLSVGQPYRGELLNVTKLGQEYWIDLEIQPILNERNEINGFMSIESDITERKLAQQRLETAIRENQALLTTLHLHSIVAVTDARGQLVDVNEAFCKLSGFAREELLGQNHSFLNSGIHTVEFWREMWMQISSGNPWHGEICNKNKAGELFWLDTTIAPFTDKHGEILSYIAISRDITLSKRQQHGLQVARDQLRKAVEIADLATWHWDLTTDTLKWDDRMYRLYAIQDEERSLPLLYKTWRSRVHPDDLPDVERQLHLALKGQASFHPAFRIFDENHQIRYIQAAAQVETDLTGKVIGMQGINRDITLDKRAEEVLREAKQAADNANKAKSEFLANMSHELRTPMNALLGMMTLLKRTELSPQQLDYVTESDIAARSLLGVLDDILDFSKIEAGKMELENQPFELDPLLQDVCLIMAASVKAKPIQLSCEVDPTIPAKLVGDALRLRQVLINLTGNAVKFTERGYVILELRRLPAELPKVKIIFAIKDSGIGIDPHRRKAIFSGFTQADSSISRRYGGSGLGVAISQRFVRMMGSDLDVQSQVGQGSTFSFELTLEVANESTHSIVSQTKWPQVVLLCPDDEHRVKWQRSLQGLEPKLQTCMHLPALRQLLQASPNAVVLLDWGNEPYDVFVRLKQEFPAVRWLAIVSLLQREKLGTLHQLDGCLIHPFTYQMLADLIDKSRELNQKKPVIHTAMHRSRLEGLRVLLAEDNIVNQKVAADLLASEGCQIICCNDGEHALATLAELTELPHLILMDLQMPKLDGFATTQHIKSNPKFVGIPIIAMTANASKEDRQQCLAAGMIDHIGKPFDFEHLVSLLIPFKPAQQSSMAQSAASPIAFSQPETKSAQGSHELQQLAAAAGIDWDMTQQRLNGQLAFYLKMLPVFIRSLGQISQDMIQMSLNQPQALMMNCHKLKGSAGQMGLHHLSSLAASHEQKLKAGEAMTEEELQALCRYIDQTMSGLEKFSVALATALEGQ